MINSGEYKQTEKLPSENALAIKFSCSRLTARKALQVVKSDGFIVSRPGKGYFVSMGKTKLVHTPLNGKHGEKEKFHVVNIGLIDSQKKIFQELGVDIKSIESDFEFTFLKTSYNTEEKPYTLLHSFVNTKLLGQVVPAEIKHSFSSFLGKKNIIVSKRNEKVLVVHPNNTVQVKMNISSKSWVVAAFSVMFDNKKNPVELAIRYTLPGEYKEEFTKTY